MVVSPREAVLVGSPSFRFDYEIEQYIASKFMIDTGAGVIDADYRGIVFILLYNHSDTDFKGTFIISAASIHIHGFMYSSGRRRPHRPAHPRKNLYPRHTRSPGM